MRADRVERVAAHLREPIHRNGYALVAATFSTSVLGAFYWAIAAHAYPSDTLGTNAALISMMMFLTNLASLNFTDVLNRFVPVSGHRARRLVDASYAIAVGLGGLAAVVFLLGRNVWAPRLGSALHGRAMGIVFVAAVMLWVVFVLQDAVLIGLRRATYVFTENTAFGVVKIVLLFAFVAIAPATGIFLSWTVPLLAVVLVVNYVIFRYLIPHHEREHSGVVEPISLRHVTPFLGADYVASIAGTAAASLMPLIVLASSGAKASGYVFITWTVAYTLYLVSRNVGMALTTEGSSDPDNINYYCRSALAACARIIVPIALALTIGAPWFLHVYGGEYATHAVGLMRLFALSAIPAIIPLTVASVARVQRRLTTLVVVSVTSTLPVLVLIPLLTHLVGLAGVGLAWLLVQSVCAAVLLVRERALWRNPHRPADDPLAITWPVPVRRRNGSAATHATALHPATAPPDENGAAYYVTLDAAAGRSPEAVPAPAFDDGAPDIASAATATRGARAARTWKHARTWAPAGALGAAALLWVLSLAQLDTRILGRFGLVSELPVAYFLGMAVAGIGFVVALHRGARLWVYAGYIALLALMLHATPAITYSELRYAWAWKHAGVIDMLQHQHVLTGSTAVLDIYRHWPGFFAASAALVDATGVKSALSFAQWGPPFFALLDAALLAVALRSLTDDRRRIALTVWLFMIANWVGQEYFSPQAFGFALYLAIIAIVLHWYRSADVLTERFRSSTAPPPPKHVVLADTNAPQRRTVAIILLVLMIATTTSHPLTPIVACLSLGALRLFRVLDRRWPVVAMASVTAVWLVTGAQTYTFQNLRILFDQVGRLGSNVNSNLASFGALSPAQHVVADMGRMVVAVVGLLAVAGFVRRLRHGYVDRAALALSVAPAFLLAAGAYGGEAIFRAYLFALPFGTFLAAGLFYPSRAARTSWRTAVAVGAVTCVLITGSLFAYYGKDAWLDYTPAEARAADLVYTIAPPNSLVIDGALSYPTQFRNVDHFTFVTISSEPPGSVKAVLADPVNVLRSWMADPRYAQGYLILTASQSDETDATGELPRGALQRIERLMLASPKVKVLYHSPDALVVTVPRPAKPQGPR